MRPGTALAIVALWLAPAPHAAADEPTAQKPAWSRLAYRGKGWVGNVRAEIAIDADPTASEREANAWIANLSMRFDLRFVADKHTQIRTWFDPRSGTAFRRTKLSLGPRPDRKIYRFSSSGANRTRIEPRRGENSLPPERWTQVRESFHGYEVAALGCSVVSAPAALVILFSALDALGDPTSANPCFFEGKTLYRVEVRQAGPAKRKVDYQITSGANSKRREGRIAVKRYAVVAEPVAGNLDESPYVADFLVASDSLLPVVVRADLSGLGKLDVELVEVQARDVTPRQRSSNALVTIDR